MVDVTEAMESDYLNVDMVRDNNINKCVIIDEGVYEDAEYKGKKYKKFNITVEANRRLKIWSPNKDSVKNISREYGINSKDWIGRPIALRIMKNNGKDVINGFPILMENPVEQRL